MTDIVSANARLSAAVRDDWGSGAIVDFAFVPSVPLQDWQVTVDLGGSVVNIWNAEVVSRSGTTYVLGAADYNEELTAGQVVEFGLQVEGSGPIALVGIDAEPAAVATAPDPVPLPDATQTPAPDPVTAASGRRLEDADETLTQVEASPSAPPPGLSVSGGRVPETPGSGDGLPGRGFDGGPLTTRGATIVDPAGREVTIHGINWFGLETEIAVPHGLWARNWREIMDEVRDLGFNALRIPFSGDLVATRGGTPSGIDTGLNPDLAGLNGLQILDAVVNYADTIGLYVLLDYHRGPPGGGPNESGLWYGNGRTEDDVIAEWRFMAERYGDAPAVIGADLVNEPFGGTWGGGGASDWARAAERIGDAVLDIVPDWLIVVEGVAEYRGDPYWWGGNLQGVADRPVEIARPDQLVYSAHDYPASVHPQPWFFDGTDLVEKFRENWGFIMEENIAPVLIGEWGSFLETAEDRRWARDLADYMDRLDVPWMWWSLNPNSHDTGGLFQDDWTTLRQPVVNLLDRFLRETEPEVTFRQIAGTANEATFTITLDAPAGDKTVLKFATTNGTARAGEDYVATAGTLVFSAGETAREVSVPILPDRSAEGDEFFYLVIGAGGALQGSATAVIVDEERPAAPAAMPSVDVASTVVDEASGTARFRVILSEPAERDVSVSFVTRAEGNGSAEFAATRGDVTIPAGEREALLEVSLDPDTGARGFTLEITNASGAAIRNGIATAAFATAPPETGEVAVAREAGDPAQLVVDLIVENDWGSGALYNVVIRNTSDEPVNAWQLAMDLPFDLSELWSAVLVADEGERVVLRNAEWNGSIPPGEAVNFGFISEVGGIGLNQILAGADLELAVQ